MNFQENQFGSIFLVTLKQLRQPKNVVKVTKVFYSVHLSKYFSLIITLLHVSLQMLHIFKFV